jgi:hypothetical protein
LGGAESGRTPPSRPNHNTSSNFGEIAAEAVFLYALMLQRMSLLLGPLRRLVRRKRMSASGGKAEIADARSNDARDRCCRKSRRFGWSLA